MFRHQADVTTSARPLRILITLSGTVGNYMAGPEMRAWGLARRLTSAAELTIMCATPRVEVRDGVRLLPRTRRALVAAARESDVVIAPWQPPFLFPLLAPLPVTLVSDLYDPVAVELAHLESDRERDDAVQRAERLTALQVRLSDLLLVGTERQAQRLGEHAAALGRPSAPIEVVPLEIPQSPAVGPQRQRLRQAFPEIGPEDRVVVWWGSIWRWLDADTAIRAIGALAARHPDLRLVVTGGRPPAASAASVLAHDGPRALAAELGLLDRHVFFYDDWIPYGERLDALAGADVGITLHRDAEEGQLASRARYLDYLAAGLPCVLGEGDDVSARMAAAGAARLVRAGDVEGTAVALEALAYTDAGPQAASRAAALADAMRAEASGARLAQVLREHHRRRRPGAPRLRDVAAVADYYGRLARLAVAARMRSQARRTTP